MDSRIALFVWRNLTAVLVIILVLPLAARSADEAEVVSRLKGLSLEQLMHVEVSTVSRKVEPRAHAAAAVSVITGTDVRRTGTRTLPDALRLAPGVHVAKVDANKWAVGIRGFTSRLSRSMLVLIDGRSVYTPLFAGVFWEIQDVLLEDLDRIEVIRGPGGTLWGANAVNGVVNVLTKNARETQGFYLEAGGGTEERGFGAIRYGGQWGDDFYYRMYGKFADRDAGFRADGNEYDDWRMGQGGFRADWAVSPDDELTFQGDLYDANTGQRQTNVFFEEPFVRLAEGHSDLSGGNFLGRWRRAFGRDSVATLQTWYDRTNRREPHFREQRDTFDVELQHQFPLPWRQSIVWGLNYRFTTDDTHLIESIRFAPADRSVTLVSGFLQDEIWLVPDRLRLTLGSKLEHNGFSGVEFQPNLRLLWLPTTRHTVWGAVSRAVRTPSRVEEDLFLTVAPLPGTRTFPRVVPASDFDAEKILAYEIGHRFQLVDEAFIDVAAFYNEYDDLLSLEPGTPFQEEDRTILPLMIDNRFRGRGVGTELSVDVQLFPWWRWKGTYSFLDLDLDRKPGSLDTSQEAQEGQSPQHQWTLRSHLNLRDDLLLDTVLRWVDALPANGVDSYLAADVRLAWSPVPDIELSAVGRNLVEAHHQEFGGDGVGGSEVQRGGFAEVRWGF